MIDDKEIHQGDYMGIGDDGILSVDKSDINAAVEMVKVILNKKECELLTIYYGADTTEDAANDLCDKILALFPECEVDVQYGGQPIYHYILSAE